MSPKIFWQKSIIGVINWDKDIKIFICLRFFLNDIQSAAQFLCCFDKKLFQLIIFAQFPFDHIWKTYKIQIMCERNCHNVLDSYVSATNKVISLD